VNANGLARLAALDVRQPWFAPYRHWLEGCRQAAADGEAAAAVLNRLAASRPGRGVPAFVDARALPSGEAYEAFVARTRCVPTRDNLHDFFNGLAWLQFTCSKRRLNALQAGEIARAGVGPQRGAVRDALTLFDENGAVLSGPAALWDALAARDWRRLFVELRPLWRDAKLLIFGHALLEKLLSPRKALTAHVWRAQAAPQDPQSLDSWLAAQFTAAQLAAKPFMPLPVLGIPGWWDGNEDRSFYDDALVFRPAGRSRT
jgi:hypothetical protein